MIDTTNAIFRISCAAEFALKLIGREITHGCHVTVCQCEEATPYFGAPTQFWSSCPHLEISRLQLYPSPYFGQLRFISFYIRCKMGNVRVRFGGRFR